MSRSAGLVVLPSEPLVDERNANQAALLLAQSLVDLCLAERIEHALRATGYPALRAVEVSVCGGVVILQGRVPSYYLKQLAQATAMEIAGVRELRNDVEVVRFWGISDGSSQGEPQCRGSFS
jgi:osmotically-inducible protein OsmY